MKRRSKSSTFKKLLTKNLPPKTAESILNGWENTKTTLQRWANAPVKLVTNYLGDDIIVVEKNEPPSLPDRSARSEEPHFPDAKPVNIVPVRRMLKASSTPDPEPEPAPSIAPAEHVDEAPASAKITPTIPQKRRAVQIPNTEPEPIATPEIKIAEEASSPMVNLPAIAAFFVDAESEDKSTYVRLKGETSWRRLSEPGASPFGPAKSKSTSPSPQKS